MCCCFTWIKGLHLLTWITVVPLKENSTGSLPWVRNLDPALSSHLVKDHIPSTSPFSVSLHRISHTIAPILWTDWYLVQIHYPGKEPVAPQNLMTKKILHLPLFKKGLLGSLFRIHNYHKLQCFWASIWLLKNKETSSTSHNDSDKQNLGTM